MERRYRVSKRDADGYLVEAVEFDSPVRISSKEAIAYVKDVLRPKDSDILTVTVEHKG